MKRQFLSFLMAGAGVFGFFVLIHSIPHKERQAFASSPSVAANMSGEDYSASQKRAIRKKISARADNVMDFSGRDIVAVLSAPELIRRDLPTVIWQYRNAECVLDLYFTTAQPSAMQAPVAHYEVRAREKGVADEDVQNSCVKDIIRARSGVNLVKVSAFYKAN